MRRFLAAMVLLVSAAGAYAAYRNDPAIQARVDAFLGSAPAARKLRKRPPAPVRTAKIGRRNVQIAIEGVGNVRALSTVEIKSRIDGQLFEAAVKDGQLVEKGDLLFRLDSRPLEAQLRQAEANLARDKANLDKARTDMARYGKLTEKGISPLTKLEDAQTSFATLGAAIRASEASVEIARLNLEYATIRAPISGRVGTVLLSPGNMVKANDTQAMLVITQVRPINVTVALPEQHIAELRGLLNAGKAPEMDVMIEGDDKAQVHGKLFFINNVVDTTTGTIQVMGRFENTDGRLVPGQFIRARLLTHTLPSAIVAPTKAIQINQKGHYVWVVKSGDTAVARYVEVGPITGQDTVVRKGLSPGEEVVTDGQLRLFPNAKIAPMGANGKGRGKGKAQS